MNWFDYAILGTLFLSGGISLVRGFVREAFSLAIWLFALWIAWTFFRDLAPLLSQWVETPSVQLGLAFAGLLVATLIIGGLVNYLLIQLVEKTGLSGSDRMIGMLFGIARGVVLVCIVVLLAGLTPIPQDPWWQDSVLVPYFEELALWLKGLLPEDISQRFQYAALLHPQWWG